MAMPSSMQTSTNDRTGGTSGVTQTFGGIDKSKTGIDPQMLMLVGGVVLALYFLTSKRRK